MSCTKPGDIVLDPFFGSGTTGAVAKKLGRNYVGIEREPQYIEAAQKRIASVHRYSEEELSSLKPKRAEARVAFLNLLDANFIKVGQKLYDSKRRYVATVKADGTIGAGDCVGSIHMVGRELQNAQSCNGWLFWHFEEDGVLNPIDVLRGLYRKQVANL